MKCSLPFKSSQPASASPANETCLPNVESVGDSHKDGELRTSSNQPTTNLDLYSWAVPYEEMWLTMAHKGPRLYTNQLQGVNPQKLGSDSHQYLQPTVWAHHCGISPCIPSPHIFHGTFQMAAVKMTAPYSLVGLVGWLSSNGEP